jgi:hypothetical protein
MKRFALISSILPLLLITASGLPQTKIYDPESNSAGITVVKLDWNGSFYYSRYVRSDTGEFTIHVKNTGSKTISAINWDFVLVDSVRGNRLYDHLSFRTDDKKIRPGETKKLTKDIDYHDPPDYVRAVVRITRVEYEDGSVWVRPASIQKK